MIDKTHALPVVAQCRLLDISRGCVYYRPVAVSPADLAIMRRLDELHLEHPTFGSRRLVALLRRDGFDTGRQHVRTLMRRMGMEAIYRKPRTSQPNQAHRIYPYLLKDVAIERPNQAWAADITYIPMARGFGYLVAIMDLYSRKVLAHRLSNTMTTDFCVEALEEALTRFGRPEIFNTDQGAQFTDSDFTDRLKAHGVAISMDGRRRWIDNVFIERLWRTVKYEDVYLKAYVSLADARAQLRTFFERYNDFRPHQALGHRTPDAVYFEALAQTQEKAA